MRDRGLAAVEHAGEIRPDDAIPFVVRHLGDRHTDAHTRAVHEHIKPAELRFHRLDRALDRSGIPHVACNPYDLRAVRRQHVFRFDDTVCCRARDRHFVAGLDQRFGYGKANPSCAAGDKTDSRHISFPQDPGPKTLLE